MKRISRFLPALCALLAVCCAAGCSSRGELPRHIAQSLDTLPAVKGSGQLLYVDPGPAATPSATLYAVERSVLGWQLALAPVAVNVGRSGVAPPWEKREGDGRTPSGVFPVRQAFGYPARFQGKVPYRQVGNPDLWVDDVQSPDYNRWVWRGETKAASFEELLRSDPLYKYALVLDYNVGPTVRDLGSAIFMHVERGQGVPTAGCVSLPEQPLVEVMQWLDPQENPQVVIGNAAAVDTVAAGVAAGLPADLPAGLKARLQGASRLFAVRRGPSTGFFAAAVTLPPEVERQMLEKKSWRQGCPVPPNQLAYLVVSYWGFDGLPHYGELVVHAALAAFVIDSMHHAFNGRFPIERMELIEAYDGDDYRSMEANNSSAFNCREVPEKPGVFSRHSYGAAIDINPRQNPYLLPAKGVAGSQGEAMAEPKAVKASLPPTCAEASADCRVLPASSAPFLNRADRRPGMLHPGDPLLTPFKQRGFTWGGDWRAPDYQHIDYDLKRLFAE